MIHFGVYAQVLTLHEQSRKKASVQKFCNSPAGGGGSPAGQCVGGRLTTGLLSIRGRKSELAEALESRLKVSAFAPE